MIFQLRGSYTVPIQGQGDRTVPVNKEFEVGSEVAAKQQAREYIETQQQTLRLTEGASM